MFCFIHRTVISGNFAFLAGAHSASSDDHLAMAKQNETNTICECQYAFNEDPQETKYSFNNIPNIHEIDEAESETEEMTVLDRSDAFASDEEDDKIVQKTKDTSDNESVYIGESFCSDESCDGSEVTNVTSESLNTSLIHITDLQLIQSSKEQDIEVSESSWKNDHQDESYLSSNEQPRATTADRDKFTKLRKCKRWNMSFTDEEMRRIERENELLLRKIMAQQKPRHKILGEGTIQSKTSSSAINRKKLQKKIEDDNMLLLRRIQQAKSCVFTNTSKMGCRLTFL